MVCSKNSLLSWLLLPTALAATLHTHDESFVPDEILRYTQVETHLGGMSRYSVMANGTIPGPPLIFKEGQTVWVRVYNDMTDANVTTHWHGVSQAAFPFSDGSPFGSQYPIPPGHFFDYELNFPNGTAGTYYYHSHAGFQASTGTGKIQIEENYPKPYPVDGEQDIFINEIFNKTDQESLDGLKSVPLVWSGENTGWMVNGKGIANQTIVDPASAEYDVINVEPGKTYRWRWIASTILSIAAVGVQEHNHTIIEADGQYTKPYDTSFMQLGAGQRFSTLFKAKTCEELANLYKTHKSLDFYMMLQSRERPVTNTGYAVIRYKNTCGFQNTPTIDTKTVPKVEPMKLPPLAIGFLDYALRPLKDNGFPSSEEVGRRVTLNITLLSNMDGTKQFLENGYSWSSESGEHNEHSQLPPGTPYLVGMYKNESQFFPNYTAAMANGGLDPVLKVYPVKMGEVIEIVLQTFGDTDGPGANGSDGGPAGNLESHPWHHHGAHYWDLGAGPGYYDHVANDKKLQSNPPVVRDTTMIWKFGDVEKGAVGSWRAWRLKITDPGVWMAHCHMLPHFVMGMMSIWIHGDRDDLMKLARPEVEGYLSYGGDVYGNSTYHPQVVHFSEEKEYERP